MSDCFLSFEQEKYAKKLLNTVSVEPDDKFLVKSITPTMQSMEIASVGHPIVLPGKMNITLACRLEGKDIVLAGKLKLDLKKFSQILREIISDIQRRSQRLRF